MRPTRALANAVGGMIFVQVILGGSATLLGIPVTYHVAWGIITFIVLVATTALIFRSYGRKSGIFLVSIASIVDFIIQGGLGLLSFGSDVAVVVHLTNAFVLAILITYLITFADRPVGVQPITGRTPPPTTTTTT